MKKTNALQSLDQEEQWYEDHADEFTDMPEHVRESLVTAAARSVRKTERMNIRMTKMDMDALRARASADGIPYQSLVTSVLHRYSVGTLVDINEARKILKSESQASGTK